MELEEYIGKLYGMMVNDRLFMVTKSYLEFRCVNSVDMFYPELAKQVKYFKATEGGQKIMCQIFEDLAEKRAEEA